MINTVYECNYSIVQNNYSNFFVSNTGEQIDLYPYSSELEKKLSKSLKDPEYAKVILEAYEKHILPKVKILPNHEKLETLWDSYLVKYCILLGIIAADGYDLFLNKSSNHEFQEFIKSHPVECEAFFLEIQNHEEKDTPVYQNSSCKIVILSSSSGGGHIVTAKAIKDFMERMNYQVLILDPDELVSERDPLILGGFKYKNLPITMGDVYSRIFQQDDDLELANELWKEGDKIRAYQPDTSMMETIKIIREINPSLILSVATHHAEHASLATRTGIPLRFVHTDYGFNNALLPIADKINSKLIQFWVNTDDREILQVDQGVLQGLKMNNLDHEPPENYENMLEKLKREGVIQVCGFPIRSSFKRETCPQKLNAIKTHLSIPLDHDVILIAMGKFGIASEISKCVKLFTNPSNTFDKHIELIVICGNNMELKHFLEEESRNPLDSTNAYVNVRIEGFLEEEEMANYYKIGNLLVSKPGGATTAEVSEMALPLLVPKIHRWELPNLSHLIRLGLGEQLQSSNSFIDQVNKLLAIRKSEIDRPVDWQNCFIEQISW